MCQLAAVSRRSFYRSLKERQPVEEEMEMRSAIQQIALEHRRRYGYQRITAELRRRGMQINHKRVARIMREDKSVYEVLQPIAGRAGQSSPGHDHVNRYPRHQFSETSLPRERVHETLALQCRQRRCGDATSEVNTAGRQRPEIEREIAGLIPKNRSKNVECSDAQLAGMGRIETEL